MKTLLAAGAIALAAAIPMTTSANAATMHWQFDARITGKIGERGSYADLYAPQVGSPFTIDVVFDTNIGRDGEWIVTTKEDFAAGTKDPGKITYSFDKDLTASLDSYGIKMEASRMIQIDGSLSDGRFPGQIVNHVFFQEFAFPEGSTFESEFTAERFGFLRQDNAITYLFPDPGNGDVLVTTDVFFEVERLTAIRLDDGEMAPPPSPVPLPASALLLLTGIAGISIAKIQRQRRAKV
ncbi:VPLPA-CTERM sorting domain-containing protein [Cereibacter sp. SYSU M97828]|nr:VPLPA-CTERM sorting domain-containing protein [Cereibacter flavus]